MNLIIPTVHLTDSSGTDVFPKKSFETASTSVYATGQIPLIHPRFPNDLPMLPIWPFWDLFDLGGDAGERTSGLQR